MLGVAFSPDGQMLATAGADGTARLWGIGTLVPESRGHVLIGHPSPVHGVAFSPDGETLATVGSDWTARLWSVETGEQLGRPVSDHCPVRGVAFHPHGDRLATAGLDGGWEACEIESDGTKGLNEAAGVILHVPRGHRVSTVGEQTAGWLRCRVRAVRKGQSPYDKSPVIEGECTAETIGATVPATNSETVFGEVLGASEGVSGQRFRLERRPLVPLPGNEQHVLEVVVDGRIEEWHEVPSFADAKEDEQCFVLDYAAGEVVLGPAVREQNGAAAGRDRRAGAVPPKRAELRLRKYATGGTSPRLCSARCSACRKESQVSASASNGARLVPLPGNEQHVLEVVVDGRIEEWHEVPSFADAKEDEQCFVLDYAAGEVVLGSAVHEQNGAAAGRNRRYGAVPPKRAELRLRKYATGGGRRGNRLGPHAHGAALADREHRVRRESPPGLRRRRRRGHRERQAARPDHPAHRRPRGHAGGLRAARPRGGARARARRVHSGDGRGGTRARPASSSSPRSKATTASSGSSSSCRRWRPSTGSRTTSTVGA